MDELDNRARPGPARDPATGILPGWLRGPGHPAAVTTQGHPVAIPPEPAEIPDPEIRTHGGGKSGGSGKDRKNQDHCI